MKYPIQNVVIPQDKRKEINEKILHIIDTGLTTPISQDDIFNAYTGDGGLHGLEFADYDSFHAYTEAKKEEENGQFFSPPLFCKFLLQCIKPTATDLVGDLTFGMGNFINFVPNENNFYGTELDRKAFKVARYLYPDANLKCDDIRSYKPDITMDLIVGNPPFNLYWKAGGEQYLSQFYYCKKAHELLKPAGLMALIVPNSFLSDDFMDKSMIQKIDGMFDFICQFSLPANSFKQVGVNHFETKMMVFRKKSDHLPSQSYSASSFVEDVEISEEHADLIYENYVRPAMEQKEKVKAKLFYENLNKNEGEKEFAFKVQKLLFDINRHPRIKDKLGKCREYVDRYYNQSKPGEMSYEEWEKVRLTPNKVLAYLNRALKQQHKKEEQDKIELVKTRYGLKLKAYDSKNKTYLRKFNGIKEATFNDMVIQGRYPFSDERYKPLFEKKQREYLLQNQKMGELPEDPAISTFIEEFELFDYAVKDGLLYEEIFLNDMQKTDLKQILQKKYGILNWQQGSGKTLAGIAWYKRLLEQKKVSNVFVVSAALSINLTWDVALTNFLENYIKITSLKDVESIRPGQVVIISFDMLVKYQRQIKKLIRLKSQKVGLIVDESDELTNHTSKRTRAMLSCFRRVQYKLLTTGTTTRNNINEIYPQLEILYNNSINMLCECSSFYQFNKDRELEEKENHYYNRPFPAYKGQTIFKGCFSPHKSTVFGIRKETQDIYNMDHLQNIIEKTIITRKFKEIVGEDKYEVITHRIFQNEAEKHVYRKIMEEFHEMMRYFKSTGNTRKDSMLRIIRQIQLLIKATSTPHLFAEYEGSELPEKYHKIASLLKKFKNEKVAIGTVFKETANEYEMHLSRLFPGRPIFLINGEVSFTKRKKIIEEFEATKNGVLISTQQSLKSSVNIPSCNKVIIESCQWNIPKIEQYYFRFIRYNSRDFKEVHFVTYEYTIEQNLLALLMAKERKEENIKTNIQTKYHSRY